MKQMRIYNDTVHDNFPAEKGQICFNGAVINLVPQLETARKTREENGNLGHSLFTNDQPAGRLLFPRMQDWKYEAHHFDGADQKEMNHVIYYWIGLWD
jgi:hypothetical protein